MTLTQTDRSIIAQSSYKSAAEVVGTTNLDELDRVARHIYQQVVRAANNGSSNGTPVQAASRAVTEQQEAFAQAEENLTNGGIQATNQIHAGSTKDELWQDYFNNPDDWYDNRDNENATINGGSSPEFRHKEIKDKSGKYKLSLFVGGKYPAPDWVQEKLGLRGDDAPPAGPPPAQHEAPADIPF